MLYPDSYEIGNVLQKEIYNKKENILSNLKKTSIESERKRLIDIYLHLVREGSKNDEYSKLLKNYKSDFPETKYSDFIFEGLPKKHTDAYINFRFGLGNIGLTHNLNNIFYTNPLFNVSMDVRVGKVYSSLYTNLGSIRVKKAFYAVSEQLDTMNFDINESVSFTKVGLLLGYFIVDDSKNLNIAPYMSFSSTTIESNKFQPIDDNQELELVRSFIFGVGCHTAIKLVQFDGKYTSSGYIVSPKSHLALILNAGYDIITQSDKFFDGNLYYANIGIVWGFGDF